MISKDLEGEILRLHHAEKWSQGTIANHLHMHHSIVKRVLGKDRLQNPESRKRRTSIVDPYLPFLTIQLEKYPRLASSVLFRMCKDRGYGGSARYLRRVIALIRPRKKAEAYFRLRTLPGEQGQVDWGDFGRVDFGGTTRRLHAFVLVLSYSRRIYLRFFLGMHTSHFLQGHQEAFSAFGGVPRTVLYDNLKSCVLERQGQAIRFNPLMLEFASHYRFALQPVNVARGNEKGRVERAIRYIRESFFAACKWKDLDDLNAQAKDWSEGWAFRRSWPENRSRTVAQAFAEDQESLLVLPETAFPVERREEVKAGKTPYIRFDRNDYSIPHDKTRRLLVVLATEKVVRILEGTQIIATHSRSWSKGDQVEDPRHLAGLVEEKRKAARHRGYNRLHHVAPATKEMLQILAGRGENLGSVTARLLTLLDQYGGPALDGAIKEAIEKGVPQPPTIALILEKRYLEAHKRPPIPVRLPDKPGVKDLSVKPHALEQYDKIGEEDEDDNEKETEYACN